MIEHGCACGTKKKTDRCITNCVWRNKKGIIYVVSYVGRITVLLEQEQSKEDEQDIP